MPGAVARASARVSRLSLAGALAVVVALQMALALWLVSPRFALDTPSLTDDWSAITRSPDQVARIVHLANPERQRFRPGWIMWNDLQWHTLDAPTGLVGPNVWNVGRILVFVLGLTLVTALGLARLGKSEPALKAALASLPVLLVVGVPWFAVDLARFGPQEPLLLGGMALGGALVVLGVRLLLDDLASTPAAAAALLLAGTALWILGVYQKEWSLGAIPLLAAACVAERERLRRWRLAGGGRKLLLATVAFLLVAPLAHVAVESLRIVLRGDLVYGARVDGGQGILHGLRKLVEKSDAALPATAYAVIAAASLAIVLRLVLRRRVDLVAMGAFVSGLCMLAFAAQAGVFATRYYLPTYALFAIALALSVGQLPRRGQVAALVVLLLVVVIEVPFSLDRVRQWESGEAKQGAVVREVSELHASGCAVAVAGLDEEPRDAVPALVSLLPADRDEPCRSHPYFLIGPYGGGETLAAACAPGQLEPIAVAEGAMGIFSCSRLRATQLYDPEVRRRVPPASIVELRRLRVPAS